MATPVALLFAGAALYVALGPGDGTTEREPADAISPADRFDRDLKPQVDAAATALASQSEEWYQTSAPLTTPCTGRGPMRAYFGRSIEIMETDQDAAVSIVDAALTDPGWSDPERGSSGVSVKWTHQDTFASVTLRTFWNGTTLDSRSGCLSEEVR